ncbi:adipose-regulatory protein [Moniliophthora roreri MCA 2997]|uniref:Adipose-regulatory protein n=1 Tax=Moniliophthora roreri (strain MCA 2997) TaxID=1381753 RepID=V2XYW2_MONRO|nr:adipose-regulatory protein [Moniliophthora roreri MCA 2997]
MLRKSLYAPVGLAIEYLRPLAPHVTPLLICVILIPLLISLSLLAGFLVWKNVAVGWSVPLYLQYGDGIQPNARTSLPTLVARQPYDVSLHLVVPAIESNFELGNFMASLIMLSTTNKTIESARKPAIVLRPPHSYLRSPPSTISLVIPFFSSFIPGTSQVEAEVHLGRHDFWKSVGRGEGREISVLSAELRGAVAHHGIRGLVTRFPLFSSITASAAFLSIISIILGACLLPTVLSGASKVALNDEKLQPEEADVTPKEVPTQDSESDSELQKTRRKRRSKSSRSSSQRRPSEPEPEPMPSATEGASNPLRRRPSRKERLDDP